VCFNLARSHGRSEYRLVDQERLVPDRSVWRQAMGWDLVFENSQIFEGGEFRWHGRSLREWFVVLANTQATQQIQ